MCGSLLLVLVLLLSLVLFWDFITPGHSNEIMFLRSANKFPQISRTFLRILAVCSRGFSAALFSGSQYVFHLAIVLTSLCYSQGSYYKRYDLHLYIPYLFQFLWQILVVFDMDILVFYPAIIALFLYYDIWSSPMNLMISRSSKIS